MRYLTLTHNHPTGWADSATDAPRSGGLSPFGKLVISEMNRLGVSVDLAHTASTAMHAALDTTSSPVLFLHSSARHLVDHPRNVPDDVLHRLTINGGVCQVTFVAAFVSQPCHEWSLSMAEARRASGRDPNKLAERNRFALDYACAHPRPRATITDVADHVEHIREAAGVDHVGLGGD